jgi:hypothetical protein
MSWRTRSLCSTGMVSIPSAAAWQQAYDAWWTATAATRRPCPRCGRRRVRHGRRARDVEGRGESTWVAVIRLRCRPCHTVETVFPLALALSVWALGAVGRAVCGAVGSGAVVEPDRSGRDLHPGDRPAMRPGRATTPGRLAPAGVAGGRTVGRAPGRGLGRHDSGLRRGRRLGRAGPPRECSGHRLGVAGGPPVGGLVRGGPPHRAGGLRVAPPPLGAGASGPLGAVHHDWEEREAPAGG